MEVFFILELVRTVKPFIKNPYVSLALKALRKESRDVALSKNFMMSRRCMSPKLKDKNFIDSISSSLIK